MITGRRMAFDFGDVRIGVAVSDPSGLLATPVTTLENIPSELENNLLDLFKEYEPIYLVVGQPKHLSGAHSAKEESVAKFVTYLSNLTQVPIFGIDERLTTVSANRRLQDKGINSKIARASIDEEAAVEILDAALNQERLHGQPLVRVS